VRRLYEGTVDEIQGKTAQQIKKSRKNFASWKIMPIFAAALRLFGFASLSGCKDLPL
jgi:hypothetical protein